MSWPSPTFHLSTPNLYISHFLPIPAHIQFLINMYNTPEFIKLNGNTGITTPEKAEKHIEEFIGGIFKREGFGMFLISLQNKNSEFKVPGLDKDSPIPIGGLTMMRGNPKKDKFYLKVPDVGWVVISEYAGKGYATEAAKGLMEWAERELGIKEVFALMEERNLGSRRVAEKLGLEYRGLRKLAMFGDQVSCVYCSPGMGDVEEYLMEGEGK